MAEQKRKSTTSSAVKRKYNTKVYTQIVASIPKELAAAFKEKCKAEGISQAQVVKDAIVKFLEQ